MRTLLFLLSILVFTAPSFAQTKKSLDHEDFHKWKRVKDHAISRDGQFVTYALVSNGEGNDLIKIHGSDGKEILTYPRGSKPQVSFDSKYVFFSIKPDLDTLKTLRRIKTKKEKLPKDTLAVYSLSGGGISKYPHLKSYKIPKKWSGWFAYQYDSTSKKEKKKDKNPYALVVSSNDGSERYEFPAVTDYSFSEEGNGLAFITDGNDSTLQKGVYAFDFGTKEAKSIFRSSGKYYSLTWDKKGNQLSFITDQDTTKALVRNFDLHIWNEGSDSSKWIANSESTIFEDEWQVSEHHQNFFSEDGKKLYFGIKRYPILQDTALLEEEIVKVEVWSYTDQRLHTQQKIEKKDDEKKSFLAVYHLDDQKIIPLGKLNIPEVKTGDKGKSNNAIGTDNQPYQSLISWEGGPYYHDLYDIDVQNGSARIIKEKVRGNPDMSANGKFAIWYDFADSAWFTYAFASSEITQITNNKVVPFYNERHDSPSHPSPYGLMSWTEDDGKVLIYDRWDIWEVDPLGKTPMKRITTNGREKELKYRYVKLDEEERFIKKGQKLLLKAFYEADKSQALFELSYKKNAKPIQRIAGNYKYNSFKKAQNSEQIIFSQENFRTFPDLLITDLSFRASKRISDANPQQKDYKWGNIELYKWTSLDGIELEGLLVKPDDFDPGKKYPLLVNFYEKSADNLNNHRDPFPHRSTINYSFYTSRGYVIFNPDVHYREGYPGESAYNCVISGVTALIEEGFIDQERVGVQGHSWGGYQVAYLVTKTDIFKCAEAGAPVPNMISAYGGIRWWTGLSRMFQYEHTQSRIGGTLWDYPQRYIENSPIFYIDKINTPLLIMHNDKDGHVPWYQGIELFVAMRRLGKPSWFLNYQGEPHWPQKLENRLDFNQRMQQFFDHYLMDKPAPRWMKEGVPAIKMGIDQGLD